eukprot:gene2314-2664_t
MARLLRLSMFSSEEQQNGKANVLLLHGAKNVGKTLTQHVVHYGQGGFDLCQNLLLPGGNQTTSGTSTYSLGSTGTSKYSVSAQRQEFVPLPSNPGLTLKNSHTYPAIDSNGCTPIELSQLATNTTSTRAHKIPIRVFSKDMEKWLEFEMNENTNATADDETDYLLGLQYGLQKQIQNREEIDAVGEIDEEDF